jgi:hypothetical protein
MKPDKKQFPCPDCGLSHKPVNRYHSVIRGDHGDYITISPAHYDAWLRASTTKPTPPTLFECMRAWAYVKLEELSLRLQSKFPAYLSRTKP